MAPVRTQKEFAVAVTLDTSVTLPNMADCNIRNIDPVLMRRMKVAAAEEGVTLRDWCIKAFENFSVGTGLTKQVLDVMVKALPFEPAAPATKISKPEKPLSKSEALRLMRERNP